MTPLLAGWIAISTLGLLVSGGLVLQTRLDLQALESAGLTNGRRHLAWSRFWREGVRVLVHGSYIYAGLAAAHLVPGGGAVIVPILIWGNVAMLLNSTIDARSRGDVFRLLEDAEDAVE